MSRCSRVLTSLMAALLLTATCAQGADGEGPPSYSPSIATTQLAVGFAASTVAGMLGWSIGGSMGTGWDAFGYSIIATSVAMPIGAALGVRYGGKMWEWEGSGALAYFGAVAGAGFGWYFAHSARTSEDASRFDDDEILVLSALGSAAGATACSALSGRTVRADEQAGALINATLDDGMSVSVPIPTPRHNRSGRLIRELRLLSYAF